MSSLIFLSENYVNESNLSLTVGTQNAQFQLSNIKNDSTVKKFRSLENTVKIVFDLQQTRSIDSIALCGDATQSLGLTSASVKFSLTTDFSSFTAVNIPLSGQYGVGFYLWPATMSYRYAELTLAGNGSYCELSNVFIGQRIELLQNSLSLSSFSYSYKDNTSISKSDYGQKFINKRNSVKTLSGGIDYCNREEHEIIDNMLLRHGLSLPIWMIVDKESEAVSDGNYKFMMYGLISNQIKWSCAGGKHFNTDLTIEQVI